MSRRNHKPKKGITLILAIMIMSAVVAIGITMSTVLIFQVRLNQVTKEGHQGYYATESGMELGLNKLNTLKSGLLSSAVTELTSATLPDGADTEYTSYFKPTGGLLKASAQSSGATTHPIVKENQSIFIELYNVDSSLIVPNPYNTPELCVFAEGSGDEVLEVSWVGWDATLNLSRSQKIFVSSSKFTSIATPCISTISGSKGFPVPLTQFYPHFPGAPFAGFRIRITPLNLTEPANGDVKNLAVYTAPTTASQIQLKSVSTSAGQKQALVAIFPWSLPLSSLFDFVIFSEMSLEKKVPITIAQDLKRFGPYSTITDSGVSTPQTPFTTSPACSSAPCTYYIRLIAANSSGWQNESTMSISTTGNGSNPPVTTLNAASCILKIPYVFSLASPPDKVTFTNLPAALTQYEFLTRPAFSTADENYCP
ncbi:MAG: pilus assembly PilX N-terminal domain-containing protein [Patescibacteria group bacterium]